MTTEDSSRTSKPSELSLSEEAQEAKDICQSLHSDDLTSLMQAVKTKPNGSVVLSELSGD